VLWDVQCCTALQLVQQHKAQKAQMQVKELLLLSRGHIIGGSLHFADNTVWHFQVVARISCTLHILLLFCAFHRK
jgi:hypothetical protein